MQLTRPKREKMRSYSKHKILPSLSSIYFLDMFIFRLYICFCTFDIDLNSCRNIAPACNISLISGSFYCSDLFYFIFFLFWEFTLSTYPPPCFVTPPIFEVTVKLPRFALSKFACLRIRWSVLVVEKKCLELFRLFFQFPSFFFVWFFIPFFLLVSPSFFFLLYFSFIHEW